MALLFVVRVCVRVCVCVYLPAFVLVCFRLRLVFLGPLTPQLERTEQMWRVFKLSAAARTTTLKAYATGQCQSKIYANPGHAQGRREFVKLCANFRVLAAFAGDKEQAIVASRTKLCYTFATNHNPHEHSTRTQTHWLAIAGATVCKCVEEQLLNYYAYPVG